MFWCTFKIFHRYCQIVLHRNFMNVYFHQGFPGSSAMKNLPAMQETRVWSLGWEDPLEEGMATHLPGESHGQRSLVGCHLWGRTESDMTEATKQQQQQHSSTNNIWVCFSTFQQHSILWKILIFDTMIGNAWHFNVNLYLNFPYEWGWVFLSLLGSFTIALS